MRQARRTLIGALALALMLSADLERALNQNCHIDPKYTTAVKYAELAGAVAGLQIAAGYMDTEIYCSEHTLSLPFFHNETNLIMDPWQGGVLLAREM